MRRNTGSNMTPEQREAFNTYHREYEAKRKELARIVLKARLAESTLKHAAAVVLVAPISAEESAEEPTKQVHTPRCLECGAELPEGHHPVDFCDWREYRTHFRREYRAIEVPSLPHAAPRRK